MVFVVVVVAVVVCLFFVFAQHNIQRRMTVAFWLVGCLVDWLVS